MLYFERIVFKVLKLTEIEVERDICDEKLSIEVVDVTFKHRFDVALRSDVIE